MNYNTLGKYRPIKILARLSYNDLRIRRYNRSRKVGLYKDRIGSIIIDHDMLCRRYHI